MKTRFIFGLSLIAAAILIQVVACHKTSVQEEPSDMVPDTDIPKTIANINCNAGPDYGNKLICPVWKGPNNDHIITPQNNPGPGKYFALPQGLVIDEATGAINVSKSECGARYMVGFVKSGSSDTCFKELIIGGVNYVDSIYVLSNNDTLAIPYFNADPSGTPFCDASDDNDYPPKGSGSSNANNKCEFDNELPPGQRANDQHVKVRTISGIINLKRSLDEGMFGATPKNGDSKDVTIYYRLSDCSNKALQKIKVRLIYYDKKSSIPQNLINDVKSKRNDFFQSRFIASLVPRPPQIIITRLAD